MAQGQTVLLRWMPLLWLSSRDGMDIDSTLQSLFQERAQKSSFFQASSCNEWNACHYSTNSFERTSMKIGCIFFFKTMYEKKQYGLGYIRIHGLNCCMITQWHLLNSGPQHHHHLATWLSISIWNAADSRRARRTDGRQQWVRPCVRLRNPVIRPLPRPSLFVIARRMTSVENS